MGYTLLQERKKILVAVDGSEQSFETVRYVSNVLRGERTRVTLFHVMNWLPESFWDSEAEPGIQHKLLSFRSWKSRQAEIIEDFMEKASELLQEAGFPAHHVSIHLQDRQLGVARDIIREAKRGYAALVLGRRGMSQVRELVMGSTVQKVTNYDLRVPVWVVAGQSNPDRILVAMDRSDASLRILDYVANYLTLLDKDLLLLHVLRRLQEPTVRQMESLSPRKRMAWFEKVQQQRTDCEREIIQSLFARRIQSLADHGVKVDRIKTKIVTGVSSRAGCVVEEAKKSGYGTIVVGRRGLSRVEEFLMGRVSSKILQLAKEMAVWVVD